MKVQDLDRISNLGFTVSINWNQDISILIEDFEDLTLDVVILIYTYSPYSEFPFSDVFDLIVDEFNHWYSENIVSVERCLSGGDVKIDVIGDLTTKINRQLKIGDILNEYYDF